MATTTLRKDGGDAGKGVDEDVFLVVTGWNLATSHRLPRAGVVVIGRAEEAPVRLIDPEASRHHARLHLGEQIEIEDLGSANGTRVRDRALVPNTRVPLGLGEAIVIGNTVLVLQSRAADVGRPRLSSHAYFESRLIEECARAENAHLTFGLVRLRFAGSEASEAAQACLLERLRPGDVLARHAPADLELLLVDSGEAETEVLVADLTRTLAARGLGPDVGLALFPRDGASPQALMGSASRKVLGAEARGAGAPAEPIVRNPAMREIHALVERAAESAINVLLLGETGTGKEVLAQEIHRRSARRAGPFLCLNCAALAESLFESELFGHERGAFTGAQQARPGLLEAAGGGTVFLDEIGEMPLALQAKLLRALETRQVLRVGGTTPRPIDVRFVAATNRDLEEEIAARRFRADLYFRLNGLTIVIPPLRERRDEIEPLARRFLDEGAVRLGRTPPALSTEALALLEAYDWPGNIRELRNVLERALLFCTGTEITAQHLPSEKVRTRAPVAPVPPPLGVRQAELERTAILDALTRCAGNQTRAAELLGMPRRTFCDRLKQYGIPRPRG